MSNSTAECPAWCDGPSDRLVHGMTPTHSSKPVVVGGASANITQHVRGDEELDEGARFDPSASLWYCGNGAIGDLTAVDCRDLASVLSGVADQLDDLARGHAVIYGEERP
ncbi:DUF6907 domain-containing protein [Aeromicrobium sp. UC242_57]|uniref:DUF6907 domain-containing protein n=1 Tax=Aeromicrobium sp. UC242_57 TaxID=3374624 RepID=UPI00379437B4